MNEFEVERRQTMSGKRTPKPPIFPPNKSRMEKQLVENVSVSVRFRPLSAREISKGDEVAWYADGDDTLRNDYNTNIAFHFDRVFGPATTTRHVYDVAAQHVVNGAMEGINGTVFAYGVTSSGKTHTMHGEQKSPGIIPLSVKDVFEIIQETPGREFLLRVSYLEIYNEVINDLLNPTGQNLRIREDAQGTYVEGIKEEVVLSPAHALSLIASGEEHRHVGSNNFNLLSSRSHTIFTLTIESSPRGQVQAEEVQLSHLHLIDLAGSESSKTETTGLRRKEGSYINKSLLTLGTVISKLTDGKSTHIPYRDSKLTRLLQSSLSGRGRISLICTVTPASSNSEETHNTLKFAHRTKHVEVKAFQNKILDEKSLIKKYQREIRVLKEELQQLRQGMMDNQIGMAPTQENLVHLKLQLEAGQVKLQSRLEEEEQAKAALMGRIQKLTKLILVSSRSSMHNTQQKSSHRRRHSFGEDELTYLPDRRHEYMIDDDASSIDSEVPVKGRSDVMNLDVLVRDYKSNRRRGMLGWFKLKKPDLSLDFSQNADNESSSASPASSSKSLQHRVAFSDLKGQRISTSRRHGNAACERTQAGELFTAAAGARCLPPTGTTIIDQMDLLQEQVKMLAGEVALCTSSLKRLSEQAIENPDDAQLQGNMQRLKDDIKEKKLHIHKLEQRMIGSVEMNAHQATNSAEISQALSKLASQVNEKTFELEIKSADNRVLQDQLQIKMSENAEMQETIILLRQQLDSLKSNSSLRVHAPGAENVISVPATFSEKSPSDEVLTEGNTPTSVMHLNRVFTCEDSKDSHSDASLRSHFLMQAAEIQLLKQEMLKIAEEKDGLEIHQLKLAKEASYAKELAAAAAVELRNLAEEVTKLSYQNAQLTADLEAAKDASCRANYCQRPGFDVKQNMLNGSITKDSLSIEELEEELNARKQREVSLVAALAERDNIEYELRKRLDEAKRREKDLENEVTDKCSKMTKYVMEGPDSAGVSQTRIMNRVFSCNRNTEVKHENETSDNLDEPSTIEELTDGYIKERMRCNELETLVSQLKGDNIGGLDTNALDQLQKLHVEAITKICRAKCLYDMLEQDLQ